MLSGLTHINADSVAEQDPDSVTEPLALGEGDGSIVVVQRLTGPDQPD